MAWSDFLFPAQQQGTPSISDDDKRRLANQGLLSAGLGILALNGRRPGTTPMQALAGGLLGGLQTVQQGQQDLIQNRYKDAQQQYQLGQLQRQQQTQELAKKFARPDGTFDSAGYAQALAQIDPQAAQEFQTNALRQQLIQAQAAQKQAPQTREINDGGNVVTQEFDPQSGQWKTIAKAPRWQPQQAGGAGGALGPGAFQLIQGDDGSYYNVNKVTGTITPLALGGKSISGANALRSQTQNLKNVDAQNTAAGALQSFDTALESADRLKSHPGLDSGTGITGVVARNIPGTDAYSFGADTDALKAQVFLPQVQNLRGMGALSDAEGKKVTDAIGALDPKMGKKSFVEHLGVIENTLKSARQRAASKLGAVNRMTGGYQLGQAPAGVPADQPSQAASIRGNYGF